MDIRKWDLQHFSLLGGVAIVFAMWPSFVQKTRVIAVQKTLSIQTSKIEPPRLAFDEIHSDENKVVNEWDVLKSKEGSLLTVTDDGVKFAAKSATQNLRTRKIVLRTMTFTHAEIEQRTADLDWVNTLPPAEQKRVAVAQEKYGTLDEDWTPPSFRELAAKKIEQAKEELKAESKSQVVVASTKPDGTVVTPDSIHTADVQVRNDNGVDLNGQVEIKGLPSGHPQWQMRIARYEDDVKKEDGQVDSSSSNYHINIPQQSGTLVAQMVDTNTGEVLGEGRMRLSQYNSARSRGNSKITIEALNNQMSASFASFYSDPTLVAAASVGRSKPVATRVLFASVDTEGQTDKAGLYSFERVQKGSWGLLRTEAKGFHPGLYMVQSGQEKRLPLFPESMIQAMIQIIRDQSVKSEVAETGSVVWGRVVQNGKPIAGAEVFVEGLENYRPVYFNSLLIPDSEMKATGENGFFAFVHLPAGYHSLVASHGPAYLSHANVVVDDETVSVAQLESTLQTEKSLVKVFDSFTGRPSSAQLEMQSLPVALDVRGFAEVNLAPISRQSFMRVHPQDAVYSDSLQVYDDSSDSIYVPLVRTDWLQSLMAARKINRQPDTGIVVGFVGSQEFETYLGHHSRFPTDQIVYFDSQGSPVAKGVSGGGFVIFNVPPGVQSVVTIKSKTDLLQTQVIPMDESGLVVLKFR